MSIRIKIILLIIFLSFSGLYIINNFFTSSMLVGTYINRNFENKFIGENPHIADTLIIVDSENFSSGYYGKGHYQLKHEITGTRIKLIYSDGFGSTAFETNISRSLFFQNPKIMLYADLDQYYEKIN